MIGKKRFLLDTVMESHPKYTEQCNSHFFYGDSASVVRQRVRANAKWTREGRNICKMFSIHGFHSGKNMGAAIVMFVLTFLVCIHS